MVRKMIAGILAMSLIGCGSGAVDDVANVEAVRISGAHAEIDATIPLFKDGWYGSQAGSLVENAAKLMREDEAFRATESVTFNFSVVTVDDLGNEGSRETFSATFPMNKLRVANFDNMNAGRTLNLAADVAVTDWRAAELLERHCNENPGPFCQRLVDRLAN